MAMYGRACSLFPRTLELLDSVGLLDEFLQIGLVAHNATNFDKFGNRVSGRGWQNIFSQYRGTFFDFVLNIRLKYSEAIIQAAYQRDQGDMLIGWEVRDLKVSPNKADEYRVTVEAGVVNSTETKELKWQVITYSLLHTS
jgi:phenol 2-monooxygenase